MTSSPISASRPVSVNALRAWILSHKIISSLVVLAVLYATWWMYGSLTSTTGQIRYVVGSAATTTIIATVSGSGQILPTDQLVMQPKVSATVVSVPVAQGDKVISGTALAYLDSTDAQKNVRDAEANLKSAEIALQKIQQPADELTLTQAQNAVASAQDSAAAAQTTLAKAYQDSGNNVVSTYLDLPNVMSTLQDIMIGTKASGGSQWNIDFYRSATANFDIKVYAYRDQAYQAYLAAKAAYDKSFAQYQNDTQPWATTTTEAELQSTHDTTQAIATALSSANALVQFYSDTLSAHNQTPSSIAITALSTIATSISKVNTDLSNLSNNINALSTDKQSIDNAGRTLIASQQSLNKTIAGSDPLDIQTTELNVTKAHNALLDAEATLADYTLRAPFDGTIALVNIHKGDPASPSTQAITLISQFQIAQLSLNEVDAAKVSAGQRVTLTFDAFSDLALTGKVISVDSVGTVSSGVVSYNVKIALDTQDPRVKAGMTVNAAIQVGISQNALAVPASAIKSRPGGSGSYVQVFSPPIIDGGSQGTATTRTPLQVPVTVGLTDDTNTEILSGLNGSEQIVIKTMTGTAAVTATPAAGGGANRGGGIGGSGIRIP